MNTVADIQLQLDGWYEALRKLQSGQEYTIGGIRNGRQLKRADLPEVRATIDWLESKLQALQTGNKIRIRKVTL
jgi:hypothetical protein